MGNIVHVYNKAAGDTLFLAEEDYMVFFKYLTEYLSPLNEEAFRKEFTVNGKTFKGKGHLPKNYHGEIELLAFALMHDHFHLVLSQKKSRAVQQLMRSLSTRYSMYFNKKHNRKGSLFQGPYKSSIVHDTHIGALIEYLHNHPTKHSSLSFYQGNANSTILKKVSTDTSVANTLPEHITLENNTNDLASIQPQPNLSSPSPYSYEYNEKITAMQKLQNMRVPEIVAMFGMFIALFLVGLRNMTIYAGEDNNLTEILSTSETDQASATTQQPLPTPMPTSPLGVLIEESFTLPSHVVIDIPEGSKISIRQYPSSDTTPVGEASHGDVFETMSKQNGWYEIKLSEKSSGFIPEKYVSVEDKSL